MKSNHYLIIDSQEGYYDAYLFNEEVDIDELDEFVRYYKKRAVDNIGNSCWNLEDLEQEIRKFYNVKEVIGFESEFNATEINEL